MPVSDLVLLGGFLAILFALGIHDLRTRRIPNRVVYPALVAGAAFAFVHPLAPWWSLYLGGGVAGALILGASLATRGGIGMGDAKLAALVGMVTGFPAVFVALAVGLGGVAGIGLALVATGRLARRAPLPLGLALAVGALVAVVYEASSA